eukprot:9159995-Prorocentrum_lima.AAC.1
MSGPLPPSLAQRYGGRPERPSPTWLVNCIVRPYPRSGKGFPLSTHHHKILFIATFHAKHDR